MDPTDWNIVVLGAWNLAILTPVWIQETALGLPPGSSVDVLVPMDTMFAAFQVHEKGLTVVPAPGQLLFQMAEPTEALLSRAMDAAKRAMGDLPRTPVRACGLNLRFTATECPAELLDRSRCKTEQVLSDEGYELRVRRRGETLAFHDGNLNIICDIPTTGPCIVTLNFDLQTSDRSQILAWLSRPASDYIKEANKIIKLIAG